MFQFGLVFQIFLIAFAAQGKPSHYGILVMAHGGDEAWNRDVEAVVAPLKEKHPTEIAFGMAVTSAIRDAVRRLEGQGVRHIAVVRMFISGESFLPETEYILGLRDTPPPCDHGGENHNVDSTHGAKAQADHGDSHGGHVMETPTPIESQSTFRLSREGVGESSLIDPILVERVKSLSQEPSRESVLILAHGPGDDSENERWLQAMARRTQMIRKIGSFREVRCETLREDWPDKRLSRL